MWIADGEKYALVGLKLNLEEIPPLEQVAPNLWVFTDTTFDVPPIWREWLGSIRAEQVEGSNLFLVSKIASSKPNVLDDDDHSLKQRVQNFYVGLLLAVMTSTAYRPVLLTGAQQDGAIDIRQKMDLETPVHQVNRPYSPIVANDIQLAAQLAQNLDEIFQVTGLSEWSRLRRILNLYVTARTIREPLDRIHQYCRCIEGLILPAIGETRKHFKSRTELFIGSTHHNLMGELYGIRSNVEHLHEFHYLDLESVDRTIRPVIMKREAIVEYIVRKVLVRIVNQKELWMHFGNEDALGKFWDLSQGKRQDIWGCPIDPLAPFAN